MSKKFISINGRTELIVAQEAPDNVSGYFCDAVLNSVLPAYSTKLRTECQFLIDFETDGAKNWRGNHLIILDGSREIDMIKKQTLSRAIDWLKNGHHIKDSAVLKQALSYFEKDKIDPDNVNDYVKSKINIVCKELKSNNIDVKTADIVSVAKSVVDNWTIMWNLYEAYEVISSVFFLSRKELDSLNALMIVRLVQAMEYQYVSELLKEDLL